MAGMIIAGRRPIQSATQLQKLLATKPVMFESAIGSATIAGA